MRKFTVDNRVVKCPNASTLGYSHWKCKRGNIILYKEYDRDGTWKSKIGRSLGRVICENDGQKDCTGHIAALVPMENFSTLFVRWIDPKDVLEVRLCQRSVADKFFADDRKNLSNEEAYKEAVRAELGQFSEVVVYETFVEEFKI